MLLYFQNATTIVHFVFGGITGDTSMVCIPLTTQSMRPQIHLSIYIDTTTALVCICVYVRARLYIYIYICIQE
jgi:hypothetical protein